MKKNLCKIVIVLVCFVCININVFSLDSTENDSYITILFHGFTATTDHTYSVPETIFSDYFVTNQRDINNNLPGTPFSAKNYLLAQGYRNVSAFHLTDGMVMTYAKAAYDDPENINLMSDAYMREIGDFNTGSGLLGQQRETYTQQCFLGLAKCEWVYRKAEIHDSLTSVQREKNIQNLLLFGPRFHDLLVSAAWIEAKLDAVQAELISRSETLVLPAGTTIPDLAQQLYDIATAGVPNRFRFICHSMGGMFVTRFLSENGMFGYYKKNSIYTNEDFTEDITNYYDLYYGGGGSQKIGDLLSIGELETILRLERENVVEKVITSDSPLTGAPVAQFWQDLSNDPLLGTLNDKDLGDFIGAMDIAAIGNMVISTILIVTAPLMGPAAPFVAAHGWYCLIMDWAWLILVNPILGISGAMAASLPENFFPPESELIEELKDTGPLATNYKNRPAPTLTDEEGSDDIEFNLISFGGVPSPTGQYSIGGAFGASLTQNLVGEMVAGIFQYKLGGLLIYAIGAGSIGFLIDMFFGWNGPAMEQYGMDVFFLFAGASAESGTVVMPASSSRGDGFPIYQDNSNLNVFNVTIKTNNWGYLNNEITDDGGQFPDRTWYWLIPSERVLEEYVMIHDWTRNFIHYPILKQRIRYQTITETDENGNTTTRQEPTKIRQLFLKDSPFNRRIWIDSKSDTDYVLPEYSYTNRGNLDESTDRDYFHFIMRGIGLSNSTLHNVAVLRSQLPTESVDIVTDSNSSPTRGLASAKIEYDDPESTLSSKTTEAVNYIIFSEYVYVMPVNVLDMYETLDVEFSINGSDFSDYVHLNDIPGYDNLLDYENDKKTSENPDPSLVIDETGGALLVSPHFKEGYNTVVFRFEDPYGSYYYKDIQIMQLTVPPFVKPLYPLMNQYVGTSDVDVMVQALDIVNGDIKPENWFDNALFDIKIDGIPVGNYSTNESDYTVSFPLYNLSDGNHEIYFKVNVEELESVQSWRFWVDTSSPQIFFPDTMIFSNKDMNNSLGILTQVEDTVPYNYANLSYDVDTVFLNTIEINIKNNGSLLENLYSKDDSKLGTFALSWNGWVNDIPLAHGKYDLEVSASDRVGNSANLSEEIIIDSQAPGLVDYSFNTDLVNINSGLLELSYTTFFDEWEENGYLDIEVNNITTGETFTLTDDAFAGANAYTLAYFVGGVNVLKDGVYDISFSTRDPLGNVGTPVQYTNILVDRTKPIIENAYVNPFVLEPDQTTVTLSFNTHENNDTEINYSPSLSVDINLIDQYGDVIIDFSPYSSSVTPGSAFEYVFNIPETLKDGKYFFELTVTDKNDNATQEYIPFVKNALPPEITYPDAYAFIDSITPVYGNVYDPKWDNDLSFDHYEVYYKLDEQDVPEDLNDLSTWLSDGVKVPAYQQNPEWPQNFGRFTIEGSKVLSTVDTQSLPDGLITLLVVAVEEDGYKIATARPFRVLKVNPISSIDVEIAEEYKTSVNHFDYTQDPLATIDYTLIHDFDNPVDIYTYVRSASGKIIKQNSYYSLNSIDILGEPLLTPEDKGIYVYQGTDDRFYVILKNNDDGETTFFCNMRSDAAMIDFVDENGQPYDAGNYQTDENKRFLLVKVLQAGEVFKTGFRLESEAGLTIQGTTDYGSSALFLGQNKFEDTSQEVTIYPGSAYPPLSWNGKDEWGRYVTNGSYTLGIEVYGKKGGYDEDFCVAEILTPFLFDIDTVDNITIQPGLLSFESSTVEFLINKGVQIQVEVLDENSITVRNLYEVPQVLPNIGRYSFTWFGMDDNSEYVPEGSYSYKITCTPLDDSGSYLYDSTQFPQLGGITVTLNQNLDPNITSIISPFPGAEVYSGRQVVQGDTSYEVVIDAKGQYLPDKTATAQFDIKGTQMVNAYPDLNFMAAFRANYAELWARLKMTKVKIEARYEYHSSTWGDRIRYVTSEAPLSFFLTQKIGSYDIESNTLTTQHFIRNVNFNAAASFPGYVRVKVGRKRTCFIWCTPWEDVYKDLKLTSITYVYGLDGEVENGVGYMNSNVYGTNHVLNSWSAPSNDIAYISKTNQTIYFNISATARCSHALNKARYLSFADGVAVMGPDIPSDNAYSKKTAYANAARTFGEIKLIDDIFTSTGMGTSSDTAITHWRRYPRYAFYYTGENYVNATENSDPRETVDGLFDYDGYNVTDNFGGGERSDAPGILYSPKVKHEIIPGNFTSKEYFSESESKVKFFLRKDANGKYYVRVESLAKDKILYPFPQSETAFIIPHEIGDSKLKIPNTYINGTRSNTTSIPNFVVPENKLEDPITKNIYFSEDFAHTFTASCPISFDQESGYTGQIPLSEMNLAAGTQVPQTYSIKVFENIALSTTDGLVQFSNYPVSIDNIVAHSYGIDIKNEFINNITGAAWSLDMDLLNADKLKSGQKSIDFDQYNKYNTLTEGRISDFYTFQAGDDTAPLNMLHTAGGEYQDNTDIIIHPDTDDYSHTGQQNGYVIEIQGIDGKPYSGLQVKEIDYFGKGLKLSDGYILEKSENAPVMLLAIYGIAEGEVTLSYKGPGGIWNDIPLNTKPDEPDVLSYWDVTGLNGLYTIRLVSSYDNGSRVNVDLKEVYLGHKVNTSADDIFITSSDGQAELILPRDSLSGELVISVDTVDIETVGEIAVLPDIAPIGEVIKLSPEGTQFTNQQALPQIHFTYNQDELSELGINPVNLTVYNLKNNGELEAINTIKQLVKVEYDEHGTITSEQVVWDSSTATSEDIMNIDFTYVKAWAVLTHFSYYLVLEGNIDNMPKIDQKNSTTADSSVIISGNGKENSEILIYVTQNQFLTLDENSPQPTAATYTDNFGDFAFTDIPLLYEGQNFIYIGHAGTKAIEYNKVVITRDTTPPDVSISPFHEIISPNNDTIYDSTDFILSISEPGEIIFKMISTATGQYYLDQRFQAQTNTEIIMHINGLDTNGSLVPDGDYTFEISGTDSLENESVIHYRNITIDTASPVITLSGFIPEDKELSPQNNDLLFDLLTFDMTTDEEATLWVWIGDSEDSEILTLADEMAIHTFTTIEWKGKGSYGEYVPDGIYYIKVKAGDTVGNTHETLFTDDLIRIDNRPPMITSGNVDNDIVVVPALYTIIAESDEESIITAIVKDENGNTIHTVIQQGIVGDNFLPWNIGETFLDGIYTITLSAKDRLENVSAQIDVTIEITHDITPPELTIPEDIVVEATDIYTIVDIGQAEATDQSPPIEITNNGLSAYPLGETLIRWNAKDRYGNESFALQKVTVIDTTPPILTIPDNITAEATAVHTPITIGDASASDIFDVVVINDDPSVFGIGVTAVTWRAEDVNGNLIEKVQLITIIDTIPPILTIPQDITEIASGLENVIETGLATATDIFDVTIINDAPGFYGLGDTQVTWTATDANGNVSTGIQTISIIDPIPPVITITGITEGLDYTGTVTPIIEITDAESGVDVSTIELDESPYTPDTAITLPGDRTLFVSATDYAQNTTTTTLHFKIYSSTSLSVTGETAEYSDSTHIVAVLMKDIEPVSGKIITFKIDGVTIGSAITQTNGTASLDYVLPLPRGSYQLSAHFLQDDDDFLRASDGINSITITHEKTSVIYTGDYLVPQGSTILIRAQAYDEDDGYPADLSLCRISFDVNKIDEFGNLIFIDNHIVGCDSSGIAAVNQLHDAGVYLINSSVIEEGYYMTSTDDALVVIYDPDGGFATGGGWVGISVPGGDTSKANFGFDAKYKNGEPNGHLTFKYKEGDIDFKSTQIDWLVINSMSAQFQGIGSMKDLPGTFTFRISYLDNGYDDEITIQIWTGIDTLADPFFEVVNQELGGGNLKVHTN